MEQSFVWFNVHKQHFVNVPICKVFLKFHHLQGWRPFADQLDPSGAVANQGDGTVDSESLIRTVVMTGTNFGQQIQDSKFWWSINVIYLFSEVEALLKVDNISLLCSTESLLQVAKPPTTIFTNA